MTNQKPLTHGLSYILGHPTNPTTKKKIQDLAESQNISPDHAWILFVKTIVEELKDEDSDASLSAILSSLMERTVKAPNLYLIPYEMTIDGETKEHPLITFQVRQVIDTKNREFIEIDRLLADQISEIFQLTFECDFVETVFVQ